MTDVVPYPPDESTLFLQACLLSGPGVSEAARRWFSAHPDPAVTLRHQLAYRRMLPLLAHNLSRHGADADGLTEVLRCARLAEAERGELFSRYAGQVMSLVQGAGIPHLVGSGVMLAECAYPALNTRHCHDLDFLIPHEVGITLDRLLRQHGFMQADDRYHNRARFSVCLHETLLPFPYFLGYHSAEPRSWNTRCCGRQVVVPSPSDIVIRLATNVFSRPQRSLQSIADLFFCLAAFSVDWDWVLDLARRTHTGLQLRFVLSYLRRHFGCQIPGNVVEAFDGASSPIDEELVLMYLTRAIGVRALVARLPMRDIPLFLKSTLAPSSASVRASYGTWFGYMTRMVSAGGWLAKRPWFRRLRGRTNQRVGSRCA